MSQRTLRRLVLATLLFFMAGISAQADDQTFTVRIENVSAQDALKLSNGKTEPVEVAPVLYVIHTNRAPLFTSGEPDRGKGASRASSMWGSPTLRSEPANPEASGRGMPTSSRSPRRPVSG